MLHRKRVKDNLERLSYERIAQRSVSKDYSDVQKDMRSSKILFPCTEVHLEKHIQEQKFKYVEQELPVLVERERAGNYYYDKFIKEWISQAKYKRLKFIRNQRFIPEYQEVVDKVCCAPSTENGCQKPKHHTENQTKDKQKLLNTFTPLNNLNLTCIKRIVINKELSIDNKTETNNNNKYPQGVRFKSASRINLANDDTSIENFDNTRESSFRGTNLQKFSSTNRLLAAFKKQATVAKIRQAKFSSMSQAEIFQMCGTINDIQIQDDVVLDE